MSVGDIAPESSIYYYPAHMYRGEVIGSVVVNKILLDLDIYVP